MISCAQFREYIIRPTLQNKPPFNNLSLYSTDAEELLIATMAHESKGGAYLVQEGGGPALGVFQMEPDSANEIIKKYKLMGVVPEDMIYNLKIATLLARLFYYNIEHPLPDKDDMNSVWEYYKKYWNTPKGKATQGEFMEDYMVYKRT